MQPGARLWGVGVPHPVAPQRPLSPAQPVPEVVQRALEHESLTGEVLRARLENAALEERAAVAEHKLNEAAALNRHHHSLLIQAASAAVSAGAASPPPLPPSQQQQPQQQQASPMQGYAPQPQQAYHHQHQVPLQQAPSPQHVMASVPQAQSPEAYVTADQRSVSPSKREVEHIARQVLTEAKEETSRLRDELKSYVKDTLSSLRQDRDLERERDKQDRERDKEMQRLEKERDKMQQINLQTMMQQQQQPLGSPQAHTADHSHGHPARRTSSPHTLQRELDDTAKQATQAEVLAERRKGLLEVKEVEMQRLRQEVHRVEAELQSVLRRNACLEGEVSRLEALAKQNLEEQDRLRRQRAAADADSESSRKKHLESDVDTAKLRDRLTQEERQNRQQQDELRTLLRDVTIKLEQTESRLTTTTEQLHSKTAELTKANLRHEAELKDYLDRPKRIDFDEVLRKKSDLQSRLDTASLRLAEHERELTDIRTLFFPLLPGASAVPQLGAEGDSNPLSLSRRIRDAVGRSASEQGFYGDLQKLLARGAAPQQPGLSRETLEALVQLHRPERDDTTNPLLASILAELKTSSEKDRRAANPNNDAVMAQLVLGLLGKRGGGGGGGGSDGGMGGSSMSLMVVYLQQMKGELDAKKARVAELEAEAVALRQRSATLSEEKEEGAKACRELSEEKVALLEKNAALRQELKKAKAQLSDSASDLRRARADGDAGKSERLSEAQRTINALTRDKARLLERIGGQETLQEELLRQLKATMGEGEFEARRFELQKIADGLQRAPGADAMPSPSGVPPQHGSLSPNGRSSRPFLMSLRGPTRMTPPAPF